MALVWSNTNQSIMDGVNILGYGKSGVGKTRFIGTMPRPLIISSERGNLSLRGMDIPVAYVSNGVDLRQVYDFLKADAGKTFDSVAMDSVTDIAHTMLKIAKGVNTNQQKAYGDVAEIVIDNLKKFRDLPRINKYFVAQMIMTKNEVNGSFSYTPDFPGKQIGQQAPYVFDLVANFDVWVNPENQERSYFMRCQPDQYYEAKDRSGVLEAFEQPDFSQLYSKIMGVS